MRKVFFFFAVAALAVGVTAFTDRTDPVPEQVRYGAGRTQENVLTATLLVEGKEFQLSLPEGSTVYQLMLAGKEQYGFQFSGREFPGMGFFVEEINGKKQSMRGNMYWIYSINGKKAEVGVSNYILKPNDIISWSYEAGY